MVPEVKDNPNKNVNIFKSSVWKIINDGWMLGNQEDWLYALWGIHLVLFFFCTNWEYLYTCHFPIKEVILARLAELRYNYQPKQSVSLIEIILKHGSRIANAVSNNLATSRSWFSVSALLIFGLGNSWL